MVNIKGKSILLIAPEFYGYHVEIILALENKGAKVNFFSEIKQSVIYRISQKICKNFAKKIEGKHLDSILMCAKKTKFDIVLVIRGGIISGDFMGKLRATLKSSLFYMYQWDSYQQNDYRSLIPFFDVVSTFDIADSKELELSYIPLFFTDEYAKLSQCKNEKLTDMVFFGAYHSDRLNIVKFFAKLFSINGLNFQSHLYLKKIPLLSRLMKGEISLKDLKYIKTYPVSSKTIAEAYAETKAVLDVELSIQSGLSMRTFEVLGSGLKLVTTNKNIMSADFYHDNQILVIDRKSLQADVSFFEVPTKAIDMNSYHIQCWLDKILCQK